jgi:ribosomal protein L17
MLYEWTSPENRIVVTYDREPQLKLVGIITHADYSLVRQDALDSTAKHLGVERPKEYFFDSLEEMIASARGLIGAEGYCVYSNNDQNITKWKSEWYLAMHRMKQALGSMEELLDFYLVMKMPDYQPFMQYIEEAHDYETMLSSRSMASKVCEAAKEVKKMVDHMAKFAESVRHLSRRDAALKIQEAYGDTNRGGYVFSFLDNKELKNEALKKLFFQVMKKK